MPRSIIRRNARTVITFVRLLGVLVVVVSLPAFAQDEPDDRRRAEALRGLSAAVLPAELRQDASSMLLADLRRRTAEANAQNLAEWRAIGSRDEWEAYRDERLKRLRQSLGEFTDPSQPLRVHVTGTVRGEGYVIENLVYESRPGQWVPGNLYRPIEPPPSMPGLLLVHSHHFHKMQGELQDMGQTWARAGCTVLVIDQVGYGERRAHPFHGPDDYAHEYRPGRQDYYYRYDSGMQLHLVGESLMGWMVHDLMRGVDLLLSRPGIDPRRIAILGAVAGGGDPAGVTAALDRRIAVAVPFNFGGPQPESPYPLPEDAETSFNYLGGAYWEATRNLRRTAADGYFHWLIVGGLAPRGLIYAHEFAWDRERDPVFRRFERIWGEFYNAPDKLAFAHGKGLLRQRPPEASHCTNIGAYHRRMIHPVFKQWLEIDVTPETEYSRRHEPAELTCLTTEAVQELQPQGFLGLVSEVGGRRVAEARRTLAGLPPDERRRRLRADWSRVLGDLERRQAPSIRSRQIDEARPAGAFVERIVLEVEPDLFVPLVLLRPGRLLKNGDRRPPVVVGLAQSGKAGFLTHRAEDLSRLLAAGTAVCLPDLRGTGETKAGTARSRQSGDTSLSCRTLLFNETLLGQRLRDLRSVIDYLRQRDDLDGGRIALWGDSFAPVNPPETEFQVPRAVAGRPHQSEPLGGLLALLGALYDEDIRGVHVRGGLGGFQAVLTHHTVYVPHDAAPPGLLTAGDLCDLAAAVAPRPLRLEALVDERNRLLPADAARALYQPAENAYEDAGGAEHFSIGESGSGPAGWMNRLW